MGQTLDAEFRCRKCGKVVSLKQYESSKFCPCCCTIIPSRQLRHWMFQFSPPKYRWFDRIVKNSETEQWLTSRHVRSIQEGDRIAIWASGEKAGLYAIGEIAVGPGKRALATEQEKHFANREDISKFLTKYSVNVRYSKVIIDRPLLEDECRKDPILADMAILKQPQGTNFRLTKEQWNRILERIDARAPTPVHR